MASFVIMPPTFHVNHPARRRHKRHGFCLHVNIIAWYHVLIRIHSIYSNHTSPWFLCWDTFGVTHRLGEVTCGNGICEAHEIGNIDSCITTTLCPQDCTIMEDDPMCGDGICHGGNGENSNTCSQDCPGRTKGRKQDRCYCGFHYDYNDDRYGADQSLCTMEQVSGTTSCCGDGVCAGSETADNCPSDC